ncbi:N-methyl-L-tryptophan oxidase-like [Saccostrea echinata]|uniref:N-methyl-L-tryptophan oxidase-like n=1 Tax=Saccostrea echinata TaxID=191078 RepID=UPI002A822741|nr:N-methyl-L-tryptophan oxidase-like [Saccostrea echinata]
MFDLCVVGAGLIGSAAAKHASNFLNVCLIGPDEPDKKRSQDSPRDIYGGHYDEGRIYMRSTSDPVWAKLAQKSIPRYAEIEKECGIEIAKEVGCLSIGSHGGNYITSVKNVVEKDNLSASVLSGTEARSLFPFLSIPKDDEAVFESHSAGYISPRRLVKAQITIAKTNGCQHIQEVVRSVTRVVPDNDNPIMLMEVTTDSGTKILAKKVLVATGAFTAFRDLLGTGVSPDTKLYPLAVTKLEISKEDANKISTMPSVLYFGRGGDDWSRDYPVDPRAPVVFYMLPPIRYPDGKYYIKLGHSHDSVPKLLHTGTQMKKWFDQGPDARLTRQMADMILSVVKGVKVLSFHGDSCVVDVAPSNRPYIDLIHNQLGVAIAGNGYAAKSSDEIGRLAVELLMNGKWDTDLPQNLFYVKLKSGRGMCISKL